MGNLGFYIDEHNDKIMHPFAGIIVSQSRSWWARTGS